MTRYGVSMTRRRPGSRSPRRARSPGCRRRGSTTGAPAQAAGPTERQVAEAELVALMREIFDASDGNYGVPRMHRELRRGGLLVNDKRVRRLMRLHGMAGRCRRRRCRTTIPGPDGYLIPDLVGRWFAPGAPDVGWCQDITYIPTGEGWLYVASVLDLGSPPAAGLLDGRPHAHRARRSTPSMAVAARGGDVAGVIAHADRGSQYISERLPRLLPSPPAAPVGRPHRGVLGQRRGRVVLGIAQARMRPGPRFATRAEARRAIFRWINWYNTTRLHSSLDYIPPIEWEQQYRQAS